MSDRVELTNDEREAWAEYAHAHGMHVDFWRDTRNGFIDGLRIQAARMQALRDERDDWHESATHRLSEGMRFRAERDAARAELAAANTRCAELEHLEHERKGFAESWAKQVAKADALQATLDRVGAFIETWSQPHSCAKNTAQCVPCRMLRDLRAALTPEGTE